METGARLSAAAAAEGVARRPDGSTPSTVAQNGSSLKLNARSQNHAAASSAMTADQHAAAVERGAPQRGAGRGAGVSAVRANQ